MYLPTIGLVGASTIVPLTYSVFVELLGDKKFLLCSLVGYNNPGQLVGAAAVGNAIDIADIHNVPGKYALSLFQHPDLLKEIESANGVKLSLTKNGLLHAFASYKDDSNNLVNHGFPLMPFMPEESVTTRFQPPAQDPEFLEAVLQAGKVRTENNPHYRFNIVCEICPGLVYSQNHNAIQLYVDMARFHKLNTPKSALSTKVTTCETYEVAAISFCGVTFLKKLSKIVDTDVVYNESHVHSVPTITRPDLIDPKNW